MATIEEISPSGQSFPLTSGALLGTFRQVVPADSWIGSDGAPLLPYHPYTAASSEPVVPGRLRVTLSTSDTPHLVPTLTQLPHLLGGVYQVEDNAAAASFVNLPLAPTSSFATPCAVCG